MIYNSDSPNKTMKEDFEPLTESSHFFLEQIIQNDAWRFAATVKRSAGVQRNL